MGKHVKTASTRQYEIGKKILNTIPMVEVEMEKAVEPVTTARKIAKERQLTSPYLIWIKSPYKTAEGSKFFLSKKGMFSFRYVACNWSEFSDLVAIKKRLLKENESAFDNLQFRSTEEGYPIASTLYMWN